MNGHQRIGPVAFKTRIKLVKHIHGVASLLQSCLHPARHFKIHLRLGKSVRAYRA